MGKQMKTRLDALNKSQNDINNIYKDTLTTLCKKHLASDISHKHMLKPKAADRRESTINNQIAKYTIGNLQVQSITSKDFEDHIEALINENRLSVSSIKKTLDVINSAFNWAISQKILSDNPCTPVIKNLRTRLKNLDAIEADDADVIVLSEEEEKKLINVKYMFNKNNGKLKYPNILYVLLLLKTGVRIGELSALRFGDWHRSTNSLTINKTRYVAKNRNDITEKGKPSDDEYIVTNRKGKPTNPSKLCNCINTIYRAAGLPDEIKGAHILRHTCATHYYENGAKVGQIASYLGDTEATISKYYIATRKKITEGGINKHVVPIPTSKEQKQPY